jgi:hypothetical protein
MVLGFRELLEGLKYDDKREKVGRTMETSIKINITVA